MQEWLWRLRVRAEKLQAGLLRPIYTVRFLSHDDKLTIGLHDLRLVCTSEKGRSILKHVLKRCGTR